MVSRCDSSIPGWRILPISKLSYVLVATRLCSLVHDGPYVASASEPDMMNGSRSCGLEVVMASAAEWASCCLGGLCECHGG